MQSAEMKVAGVRHPDRGPDRGLGGGTGASDVAVDEASDRRSGISWSFRSVLFVQAAALALIPLLVVVLVGTWLIVPQFKQAIEWQHQSMTHAAAAQVETHLRSARRELVSVAALIEAEVEARALHDAQVLELPGRQWAGADANGAARDIVQTDRLLDSVVGNGDLYEAVYLTDREGVVTALGLPSGRRVARRDLRGIDLSRRAFVQEAMKQGEPVWSSAFLSVVSGRLSVALAIPVKQGMLVAELALGQLSYFLRELPVSEQAAVLVLDRTGHVIAHPRPALAGQQINLNDDALVQQGFTSGRALGSLHYEGREMIGAVLAISGVNWLVLVAQPVGEAFATIDAAMVLMLGAFAFALLAAAVLAFVLASSSARRLGVYAQNAGALADGDFDVDWPSSRVIEFARLAGDLKRMAQAIRTRESDLRESQARYREVVQSSADLITRVDREGRFLFVNQAAVRVLGLQPEQCIGRLAFEFTHVDDREKTQAAFARWLEADTDTASIENRQVSALGKTSNIVWSIHAHRDAQGQIVEFSSIGHDMTDYRRAESEIRRLALVASATSSAVMICDAEGRVEWINSACELMTGFTARDLHGHRPWDRRSAADTQPNILSWIYAEMRAGRGVQGAEFKVAHKSGRTAWSEVEVQPVKGPDGVLMQFVVIESDISARRQAQDALQASEERLRATLENTPNVAIQWYDAEGRVTYWNHGSERIYGIEASAALGRVRDGLIERPLDAPMFKAVLAELARTGKAVGPYESSFRRPDGSGGWALTTTFAIPGDAGDLRFVGMDVDITEQRQLSERLKDLNQSLEQRVLERTAALASTNAELRNTLNTLKQAQDELINAEKLAALGALVAGVAHELNTPIGNGLMAATTLSDHAQSFDKTLQEGNLKRSTLDHFVKDVRSAADIVVRNLFKASELLTSFKQVAVDRTSAQRREFKLDELVGEIVLTLRPSFRKTPYQVVFEVAPDLKFDSYPGPFGQVLSNLINNALVHAFEGRDHGVVMIRAEAVDDDTVEFSVRDDGVGIPEANLPRIFDPFFTTKLGKGGSGLGLNIVYRIVTRVLGGRIKVDSSPAGTAFLMRLPRVAPEHHDEVEG